MDRLINNEQGNDLISYLQAIEDNVENRRFLQSKTVTPSREQQTIVADEDYLGLSEVIVEPGGSAVETLTLTLLPSSWRGVEPPYIYDLGAEYAERNVIVGLNSANMTDSDIELIGKFMIEGGETGRYLYAHQWHPSVNIPVIIQYTEGS